MYIILIILFLNICWAQVFAFEMKIKISKTVSLWCTHFLQIG